MSIDAAALKFVVMKLPVSDYNHVMSSVVDKFDSLDDAVAAARTIKLHCRDKIVINVIGWESPDDSKQ